MGRTSLKRWQYIAAEKGNTAMLIWLGKQYLGQSDKMDQKVVAAVTSESADLSKLSKDELMILNKAFARDEQTSEHKTQ